jgi:hypothetical protein
MVAPLGATLAERSPPYGPLRRGIASPESWQTPAHADLMTEHTPDGVRSTKVRD